MPRNHAFSSPVSRVIRWGIIGCGDVTDMKSGPGFQKADLDAVYIATPPDSHCEYALLAAKAGKPAYIEKPFARNSTAGQTIQAAFQEHNLPVYVAYY